MNEVNPPSLWAGGRKNLISQLKDREFRTLLAEELDQVVPFLREFTKFSHPESPVYRSALSSTPASPLGVGGDYLRMDRLDEERLVFLSGDVAGQGMRGAVIAALLHNLLEHNLIPLLKKNPQEPHRLLEWLNKECRLLFRKSPPLFFSLAVGVLDETAPALYYAAAGVPPLFLRLAGEVRQVDSHGTVLGVLPRRHYRSLKFSLTPGDTLLCCSDGYYPAGQSPMGELNQQFTELLTAPGADINDHPRIIRKIESFIPREGRDDRALLTISVRQDPFP